MTSENVNLRRLIDVTVVLLTVLATVAFSLGRSSIVLPICSVLAGVAALSLPVASRLRLHRHVVNGVILVIAAGMATRLMAARASLEYSSLADGFVYLQCVLLFEKRTFRTWWDLMTLSFILLFVAGQLVQGPSFGLLLVAYFFCGAAAFAEIHIYRERIRWRQDDSSRVAAVAERKSRGRARTDWLRVLKVAFWTLLVGPFSLFMRFRDAESTIPADDGEPERPAPRSTASPALGRHLPRRRQRRPALHPEFWRRIFRMTCASLGVACAVFLVTPRFGRFEFDLAEFRRIVWGEEEESIRTVGYRDTVELGELGAAFESPEKALTIRLTDYAGQQAAIRDAIYLRGAVLTRYGNRAWEYRRYGARTAIPHLGRNPPESMAGIVTQHVTMEAMEHTGIFSVWPPAFTDKTDDIWYEEREERFRRPGDRRKSVFSYELATTGFSGGTQVKLTPCDGPVSLDALRQMPDEELPELVKLAEEWILESDIPATDPVGRAEFLTRRLSSSSRFSYSQSEQERDVTLDPVEDFIANNPRGNCEYFATALALMLRSQGIPARLVVGYRTDECGYFDQGYLVRQEHAHSWVEAYIPPDQCGFVRNRCQVLADWTRGGWLRLDPTPSSSGVFGGFLGRNAEHWLVRFRSFWSNRIVGMNNRQRRDIVYGTLFSRLKGIGNNLFDPDWWSSLSRNATREENGRRTGGARDSEWTLWYGGMVGMLLAMGAVFAGLRLRHRTVRRTGAAPVVSPTTPRRAPVVEVPFYDRLESLLRRYGFQRDRSQTPREFVRNIGDGLAETSGEPQTRDWLREVAEAYYSVRYGSMVLDHAQTDLIQGLLKRLERLEASTP